MSDPDDKLSLEEAREVLFGIESPYSGNELSDKELEEYSDALDIGDDPPDDFSLSEAHDLATGKAVEEEL